MTGNRGTDDRDVATSQGQPADERNNTHDTVGDPTAERQSNLDMLVRFYKALADPTRLRLVGLLARLPMYGQELAEALEVKPATISHHLGELRAAGLLRERKVDNYRYFDLDTVRLRQMSGTLLENELLPARAPRSDERAWALSAHLVNGRLTSLPRQRKSMIYILEELVKQFAYDRRYTEAEVNTLLGAFHEDVAYLRRELIGRRLLARERGVYWRIGDHVENDQA